MIFYFRCAAEHMASVRDEVSVMLEKLLEKLTALEQYEESLVEAPQVTSVEQLAHVSDTQMYICSCSINK